ncbi:MAG TPA: ATP synthase F0 subunit C [Candidatus Mailhella merdavium]|nr:ATP synthase F0 subunit C [Candidatus Mailhella merdavium]
MRKLVVTALSTVMMVAMASVAFAADDTSVGMGISALGMAIGIAIAAAGCGLGQGMAIKAACEGTARNPDASGKISQSLILGLAFVESLCIYALLVDLILLFVKL